MSLRAAVLLGVFVAVWGGGQCAVAATAAGSNFFALDAGFFSNNVVGRANALEADQTQVSHYSIYARLRRGFHLGKNFYWEPAFDTQVPWYSGVDGSTKLFTFHTDLPFLIPVFSFLKLRAGPGVEWQLITSSASVINLGNGTATQDFYTPGGMRVALLGTVRLGMEIRFSRRICFNADVTVLSVASKTRRSYQAALGLGIYL